jgi:predicted kinase
MTVTAAPPTVLALPRRSFVLVAGIPGAGKSRLLASRPLTATGAVVLDSDPVRDWLRARLPAGTSYRYYRGLVHLWHRTRIAVALLAAVGPVVVHLPATSVLPRLALAVLALLAGRHRCLVWLHAEPEQARRGQLHRGRVLTDACFRRHARRGSAFVARLRSGHRPPGWHRVVVLDRRRAPAGLVLEIE